MKKTIYIIAGEASGDVLGAPLVKELKKKDYSIIGVGGPLMEKEGLKSLFPMHELSIMGIFEIIPRIFHLKKRIKETVQDIIKNQPDAVITIDSPGFSKRVVKQTKHHLKNSSIQKKIYFLHYVAPSVWAWRPGRAKKMSHLFHHLFCLLPFEPPYFIKHQLPTTFVGHTLVDYKNNKLNKPNNCINILLLPGSRKHEIQKLLPIFLETLEEIIFSKILTKPINVYLPTHASLKQEVQNILKKTKLHKIINIIEKHDDKTKAFENAHYAIAASGTVSLELAKYKVPHVIAYKVNMFTAFILKFLLKSQYIALPNILAKKEIVPECLQGKCTKKNIFKAFNSLIQQKDCHEELYQSFLQLTPPDNKTSAEICADIVDQYCHNKT